ncbi:MAG: FIST C-terminal domain-containing protein [Candidatus Cloacimonetes bacterium]|nr:FIST C-terminal domain-containing protein [Candidatus Cloacimonadota bacterium]
MIKSFTATTREIDDPKYAVSEIMTALDLEKNLLKNSIGIISCFSEFVETGVLKAICDALPFDCIGTTTCLCASGQEIDQLLFAITVLTSDDCEFKTTKATISEDFESTVRESIDTLFKSSPHNDPIGRDEIKPTLFLGYFPLIKTIGSDVILATLDKAIGGIPVFGTVAVDHKMDYSTALTIHNGEAYRDVLVLGAIYGSIEMKFEVASINEDNFRKQRAIITESNGNILIGVNGKSAIEYLEEIGLTKEEIANGLGVIPLIVDHKDGTKPVARAVFATTPEGYVVCGGAMPVGATLAIGRVDVADVLSTSETSLKPLLKEDSVLISYSCIARYLVLQTNSSAEAEKIQNVVDGKNNYIFTISGGEICPLVDSEGVLKNYFHNYTNVFCRLR